MASSGPGRARRRVLLVDAHFIFVEALGVVLGDQPDLEVVGSAHSVARARAELALTDPDVVLLNVAIDNGAGEALMTQLAAAPAPLVAVLTESEDPALVARGLACGVAGWLSKAAPVDQVIDVVRALQPGQCHVSPTLLGPALRALVESLQAPTPHAALSRLTARELEVLQCLVDGCSRAETAQRLMCSENTARTHTQNLLAKLKVHSVVEAVGAAMRLGMRPEASHR